MHTLKTLAVTAVLATVSFFAVPVSAAPPTPWNQTVILGAAPAMPVRQDPVPDERAYPEREAQARELEDFTGGAIGIVAAILIVILVLLLI
jgi:hypothetical protein